MRTRGLSALVVVVALIGGCKRSKTVSPPQPGPEVAISIAWPGASPSEVEGMLAAPVEAALQSLPGLERLESRSREGALLVVAQAGSGVADRLAWEKKVRMAIEKASEALPEGVEAPVISSQMGETRFLVVLGGDLDRRALQALGRELRDSLERVPGVARVWVAGERRRGVTVEVDAARLKAYGLSLGEVADAMRDAALDPGGPTVATRDREFLIRTGGRANIADLERLVLKITRQGVPVYLRDLAEIEVGFAEATGTEVFTPTGPGLVLGIDRLGAGPKTGPGLATVLEQFVARLPPGVRVETISLDTSCPACLVVGRLDFPPGTPAEKSAELLGPVWRQPDLLAGAGASVLIAGAAELALPPALTGHDALLLATAGSADDARAMAERLAAWVAKTPGLKGAFRPLGRLLLPGARIEVTVCTDVPEPVAAGIARKLADRPGVSVSDRPPITRPELQIEVDRMWAGHAGLTAADVHRAVRLAVAGEEVMRLQAGGEAVPVRLRQAPAVDLAADPAKLVRLPVSRPGGPAVPLAQVARISQRMTDPERLRVNARRCARLVVEPDAPWKPAQVEALEREMVGWLPPGATVAARRL